MRKWVVICQTATPEAVYHLDTEGVWCGRMTPACIYPDQYAARDALEKALRKPTREHPQREPKYYYSEILPCETTAISEE